MTERIWTTVLKRSRKNEAPCVYLYEFQIGAKVVRYEIAGMDDLEKMMRLCINHTEAEVIENRIEADRRIVRVHIRNEREGQLFKIICGQPTKIE
jgi:hypothetical protein